MILFQRAIPKISLTFDRDACTTPGAKINHCMIYCAAKPAQYTHFIVKALLEDWLLKAREPYFPDRPSINLRFDSLPAADRDQIFHNGYSILYLIPGKGPVLHWGYPGDVGLIDLMGMATLIKTFQHYYETELKFEIAKLLQSVHPVETHFEIQRSRLGVQNLFQQIANTAYAQRVAFGGRGDLYVPPEKTSEDEYFHMVWHYMTGRAHTIRVDFENFELKFRVPQKLFDLFDTCFGQEITYLMVPQGE